MLFLLIEMDKRLLSRGGGDGDGERLRGGKFSGAPRRRFARAGVPLVTTRKTCYMIGGKEFDSFVGIIIENGGICQKWNPKFFE